MTLAEGGLWVATWGIVAVLGALFAIYIAEIFLGLWRTRDDLTASPGSITSNARTVILVPAHNEAANISKMLGELQRRIPDNFSIMVVADNCTDDTAGKARAAAVDVVERNDPELRGKPYALSHGRDALARNPPDCVIVMDADCMLAQGAAEALVDVAMTDLVPVQATYLLQADTSQPAMVQISNFAMLVKNLIRQRGMTKMGGAALLTGTGMAFPWKLFAAAPLANNELVEDLVLGIGFVNEGVVPQFLESATVVSDPATSGGTLVQRTRWEHGFLHTARRHALPLIFSSGTKPFTPRLLLGLHLLVPPLALLFAMGTLVLGILTLMALWTGSLLPVFLLLGAMFVALAGTFWVWWCYGRGTLSLTALLRVPLYIMWKIPIYLKLLMRRETRWIRTPRAGDDSGEP